MATSVSLKIGVEGGLQNYSVQKVSDFVLLEKDHKPVADSDFRRLILEKYKYCLATGTKLEKDLEVAHILPYEEGEPLRENNAILLRRDLCEFFQQNLWSVTTSSSVEPHILIGHKMISNPAYSEMNCRPIQIWGVDLNALKEHFERYCDKERDGETFRCNR